MLACALLPLLFMPRSQAPLPYGEAEQLGTTRSQRAELFTRYFTDGELERRGFEPTMDEREGVIACRALANSVLTGPLRGQYAAGAGGRADKLLLRRRRGGADPRDGVQPALDGGLEQLVSIHIDLDTQEVYRAYISEPVPEER